MEKKKGKFADLEAYLVQKLAADKLIVSLRVSNDRILKLTNIAGKYWNCLPFIVKMKKKGSICTYLDVDDSSWEIYLSNVNFELYLSET